MAVKPQEYLSTMSTKRCAICEKILHTSKNNVYFCSVCYKQWGTEIRAKERWIRFVTNEELARRRRREPYFVYLGDTFDIDDRGRLVRRSY